jgi:nitroimidazol reductase NimA-like FMN-containing flavoprotein (pyridoxamine 5'-phosphate oxidase superfamily)
MALLADVESFISERRNVVVAGVRKDGRAHVTPNGFHWDGENFYISTIRDRAKYAIFRRDPRATLLFDDPTGFRAVIVPTIATMHEDVASNLDRFKAIRDKYG